MHSNSQIRAFVVDDEPVIANSIATILRLEGFSARSFTDPLQALANAMVDPPDLLLSDVVMPTFSGIELAFEIRSLRPECKILFLSGQRDAIGFLHDIHGPDAHLHVIPKPVHPSALLAIIRQKLMEDQIPTVS